MDVIEFYYSVKLYVLYIWIIWNKDGDFFCQIGNFIVELGNNILFGIGNGAENQVIESPGYGQII